MLLCLCLHDLALRLFGVMPVSALSCLRCLDFTAIKQVLYQVHSQAKQRQRQNYLSERVEWSMSLHRTLNSHDARGLIDLVDLHTLRLEL